MAKRTILVDSARRELEKHGTETFPMTVNHDDLWSFEGKNVPIHWHNDLEINLIREGEAVFQVYQKSYRVNFYSRSSCAAKILGLDFTIVSASAAKAETDLGNGD